MVTATLSFKISAFALSQAIPHDKRMAVMEFQLRNFQVSFVYNTVGILMYDHVDSDGRYKGHPDLRTEQVHIEGSKVSTSSR